MSSGTEAIHYGFVTTVEIEQLGLCGGLLLLNQVARPLEFHCTLPIKPTRSQEILYGKSLKPFLCGQIIAKALVEKAKSVPHLLITDCLNTLSISPQIAIPALYHGESPLGQVVSSHVSQQSWNIIEADKQQVFQPEHSKANTKQKTIEEWLVTYCRENELAEPFERIRQAINEAHNVARNAA